MRQYKHVETVLLPHSIIICLGEITIAICSHPYFVLFLKSKKLKICSFEALLLQNDSVAAFFF